MRQQVLFRSGEAVERLADVKAICLDKTGTLTTGTPHVNQTAVFGDVHVDHALCLATQLASSSSHPFARAVAKYVATGQLAQSVPPPNDSGATVESVVPGQSATETAEPGLDTHGRKVSAVPVYPSRLQHPRTVPGGGVEATTCDGQLVRLGSVEFSCCSLHQSDPSPDLSKLDLRTLDLCVACTATVPLGLRIQLDRLRMAADQQSASIVLLSVDRIPVFGFLIAESIRPEAQFALRRLAESSEALHVLSSDRSAKGRFLKEQLQVGRLHIECSLNPEQKVLRVAEIRRQHGTTVMVGDGINDAPALAASDVGIAMGCGADVSRDSAQVCLLSNDLTRIPWTINLARRTRSIIRQNLAWAFGYNIVGFGMATAGIMNPAVAAGLMTGSSLLVVFNSLRLLRNADLRQPAAPSCDAQTSSNGVSIAETDIESSSQADGATACP